MDFHLNQFECSFKWNKWKVEEKSFIPFHLSILLWSRFSILNIIFDMRLSAILFVFGPFCNLREFSSDFTWRVVYARFNYSSSLARILIESIIQCYFYCHTLVSRSFLFYLHRIWNVINWFQLADGKSDICAWDSLSCTVIYVNRLPQDMHDSSKLYHSPSESKDK